VKLHKNKAWTLFFVSLGYLGAAVFYSYLIGINANIQILCLVCPHITSSGAPVSKFIYRTLFLGTLNALFLLLVGWLLISAVRFLRRTTSKPQRSPLAW
jgi:hypothetical protein